MLSATGWPNCVVPLKKVTVPVGVPLPEAGATVAVAVTGPLEPTLTELGERASLVVVGIACTVNCAAGETELAKVVSPLYCAVME